MREAVFPEKPAVRPLEGSDYELAQEYWFLAEVGGEDSKRTTAREGRNAHQNENGSWDVVVKVKPGFRTDGASIPRFLWRVFGCPYDPDIIAEAIAHDALYRGEIIPRKDADAAFLRMMEESGVPEKKRRLVWRGVRWFGWITWLRHTPESVASARWHIKMDFASHGAGRE